MFKHEIHLCGDVVFMFVVIHCCYHLSLNKCRFLVELIFFGGGLLFTCRGTWCRLFFVCFGGLTMSLLSVVFALVVVFGHLVDSFRGSGVSTIGLLLSLWISFRVGIFFEVIQTRLSASCAGFPLGVEVWCLLFEELW